MMTTQPQTRETQLDSWLAGIPLHREQGCCPDFSCCQPSLLAPREVREVFAAAHRSGNTRLEERMLMEFLGKALGLLGKKEKVHIAGLEVERRELDV